MASGVPFAGDPMAWQGLVLGPQGPRVQRGGKGMFLATLCALATHPEATNADLARLLEVQPRTTRLHLRTAEAAGWVVEVERFGTGCAPQAIRFGLALPPDVHAEVTRSQGAMHPPQGAMHPPQGAMHPPQGAMHPRETHSPPSAEAHTIGLDVQVHHQESLFHETQETMPRPKPAATGEDAPEVRQVLTRLRALWESQSRVGQVDEAACFQRLLELKKHPDLHGDLGLLVRRLEVFLRCTEPRWQPAALESWLLPTKTRLHRWSHKHTGELAQREGLCFSEPWENPTKSVAQQLFEAGSSSAASPSTVLPPGWRQAFTEDQLAKVNLACSYFQSLDRQRQREVWAEGLRQGVTDYELAVLWWWVKATEAGHELAKEVPRVRG